MSKYHVLLCLWALQMSVVSMLPTDIPEVIFGESIIFSN
jgi:hypothetical protein